MNQRLYPINKKFFQTQIMPIIQQSYIWKGRPPVISHYKTFCAILYVLRTGIPWRDLPKEFGSWHAVFDRYNRGTERGLWWKILTTIQAKKLGNVDINIVMLDSTTMKIHRHGGGQKGGCKPKGLPESASARSSTCARLNPES